MISENPEAEQKHAMAFRSRAVFSNLALLIAATLLSFLFAEIVVGALGLAPSLMPITRGRFRLSPNLKIGYEPISNLQYRSGSLDGNRYTGTSNRLGYRGPAYPEAKASEIYRIVVLGDSITEGLGVDQYEKLYSAKIERALREEGIDAQVFNFGVTGYNTQQEVETLKDKGLRLHPDLVLLAYSLNDTAGPSIWLLKPLLDEINDKKDVHALDGLLARYWVKSALYRLLRFRLLAPNIGERKELTYQQYATGDTVAKYANEFGRLSESHGFQALVVVFPFFTDRSFTSYEHHDEHRFIHAIAMEQNLLLLDLLPVYTACVKETQKLFHDNLHPNARGHSCAASAIAGFILETIIPDDIS